MRRSYIPAMVLMFIGILINRPSLAGQMVNSQDYKTITPRELAALMEAKKDFTLIDVHVPEQKHLAGTDEFIAYDQISNNQDKLPADKNRKIVVYCRSGNMSAQAAHALAVLGYTQVADLMGGENNWNKEGLQVNGPDRIIYLTAQKFNFTPAAITVKQGQKIKIIATSIDVVHGFALPEYQVNTNIAPNQETIIEFLADKPGDFTFFCSVYCGPGHNDMKGTLTVEEE